MIREFCKEHPKPSRTDVQGLCKSFKAKSNGVDIFPKLPTMISPAIKRWKINQSIVLLKLQAGNSYEEIFQKLASEKTNLPSPDRGAARQGLQQSQSYLDAQSANSEAQTANGDAALQQLTPTRVPPLNAPAQHNAIPPSFNTAVGWVSSRSALIGPSVKVMQGFVAALTRKAAMYLGSMAAK